MVIINLTAPYRRAYVTLATGEVKSFDGEKWRSLGKLLANTTKHL